MSFPLFKFLLLVCVTLPLMQTDDQTDHSCDEEAIEQELDVDQVCADSYDLLVDADLQNNTQEDLDFAAAYLCGDHCGEYFEEAAESNCEDDAGEEFVQLHCACIDCVGDTVLSTTVYCAYTELLVDLDAFVEMCGVLDDTCSSGCAGMLQDIVDTVSCCLRERFDSSIGYLRSGDEEYKIFGNETLYDSCSVSFPDRCEDDEDSSGSSRSMQPTQVLVYSFMLLLATLAI